MGRTPLGSSSPKETPTLFTRELLLQTQGSKCDRAKSSQERELAPLRVSWGVPTGRMEATGVLNKTEERPGPSHWHPSCPHL